ncbi:DoxX family protein [Streptosporangium sp. NBC_01755]|nr:DoxX family protein [Streptosporangium sp. NBC_01755]WSA27334.1 DoxX family protein [Streptosporangium sp. NBC_01810]WSD01093.1 DoxX family protein [Streptosporangium sp. NBC_01755]
MQISRFNGPVLSLFRIVTSLLFLCHGLASMFGVFGGNHGTGQALAFGVWPGWWAALIQVVCGGLVLAGFLTRVNAILASGSMAYAYFMVHLPQDFMPLRNGGEPAALFCWSFLIIAVLGPGPWAVDTLLQRRRDDSADARPIHVPAHAEGT